MKTRGLVLVTLATLALTGAVLTRAGWFAARAGTARGPSRARDTLSGAAVWRWQHSQPAHWRACILQN
jgi:hypothetical protein